MNKFQPIPESILALFDEVEYLLQDELAVLMKDELGPGEILDINSAFFNSASFRQMLIHHSKLITLLEVDGIEFGPDEDGIWGATYQARDLLEAEAIQEATEDMDDIKQFVEELVEGHEHTERGKIIQFPTPKKRNLH